MPNRKIKHIVAKLVGASTEETLDVYDVDAVHTADIANNLTTTNEGYVLDARQGKALNDSLSTKSTIATVDIFTSNDHVIQVNSASGNVVSLSNFISAFVIDTNNLVAVPYTYSNLVYLVVKNNSNMQNASDGNYKIRVRYYT